MKLLLAILTLCSLSFANDQFPLTNCYGYGLGTDGGGMPKCSTATLSEVNGLHSLGSPAPLASPAFTGTPTVNGGKASDVPFVRTCTLTSAAAGTAVHCLADADVGAAQKVYLTYWHLNINGATAWATTATCTIQDTNGTPVVFETIAVAAMTGNAFIQAATTNVTNAAAFLMGTGGTVAKGLDVKCNANGTGSDAVFTISGFMK